MGRRSATVSAGSCDDEGLVRRFRTDITASGRTCSIDGKKVHKVAEYFGGIRCMAFTPSDGRIVSDEPACAEAGLIAQPSLKVATSGTRQKL